MISVKLHENRAFEIIDKKLSSIPIVKKVSYESNGFDVDIVLNNGERIQVQLIIYKEMFPRYLSELILNNQKNKPQKYYVIIAPYISDKVHELCEKNNIGYFDHSGNCLFYSQSIYISEKGNINLFKHKRSKNNIFNANALVSSKILRVIMKDINTPIKLKHLSEKAHCSIGQVSKVKDYLYNHNLAELTNLGLVVKNANNIMREWSKEYVKKENNKVLCFTLDELSTFESKLEQMKEKEDIDYYLTGFSGGVRYAPVVNYNKVHVYIPSHNIEKAIQFLKCKKVESGANVVIYPLEDDIYTFDSREINGASVVSPVQSYLDCMMLEGRGEEEAEEIFRVEIDK